MARITLERSTNFKERRGAAWKHGIPETIPDADVHLVHTKHPFAWLLSMERWWGIHPKIERALTRAHVAWNPRDAVMRAHATRLDAYHSLVRGLLNSLPSAKTMIVRYEDFLETPKALIKTIAKKGDAHVLEAPEPPSARVDSTKSVTENPFDPTYYTEKAWAKELSRNEVNELHTYVEECGYATLFWDDLSYNANVLA